MSRHNNKHHRVGSNSAARWTTYLMFLMFAMTTDAVGVIIPEAMRDFSLSMTQAGLLHYGPMAMIALSGMLLGFLADKMGRRATITIGLVLYGGSAALFAIGSSFAWYLLLMMVSGIAIGVFKTGALALIGDISSSTRQHTSTMNGVEAFFGVGAILGPLIVTYFLKQGISWTYLYIVAALFCLILLLAAQFVHYPSEFKRSAEPVSLARSFAMLKDRYVLGFSLGAFLYVATEAAIYVWMPTYLLGYQGPWVLIASYALTLFFVLRALGRFLGIWIMAHLNWAAVLALFSGLISVCFIASMIGGRDVAVILLPLTGLFMSVIYPTLNSKGISCHEKDKHGTVAGVILFFSALGAAVGPLLMGVAGDVMGGDAFYGFVLATGFSILLCLGLVFNYLRKPVDARLSHMDATVF